MSPRDKCRAEAWACAKRGDILRMLFWLLLMRWADGTPVEDDVKVNTWPRVEVEA